MSRPLGTCLILPQRLWSLPGACGGAGAEKGKCPGGWPGCNRGSQPGLICVLKNEHCEDYPSPLRAQEPWPPARVLTQPWSAHPDVPTPARTQRPRLWAPPKAAPQAPRQSPGQVCWPIGALGRVGSLGRRFCLFLAISTSVGSAFVAIQEDSRSQGTWVLGQAQW